MELLFSHALRLSGKRYRNSSLQVQLSRWKALCLASSAFRAPGALPSEEGLRQALATFDSPTTRKRMFLLYRWVLHTLIAEGAPLKPPSAALEREYIGDARTVHTVVDPEEHILRMSEAAVTSVSGWKGRRLSALISVLGDTGLRTEEVRMLPLSSFASAPAGGTLTVPAHQGAPARTLDIGPAATARVLAWLTVRPAVPGNLLFPADLTGRALDPATIWRQIKRIEALAGTGTAPVTGATALRAAFAGRLKRSGASVIDIQHALGHRHQSSTSELLERVLVLDLSPEGKSS